jgi:hypothetical protein
LGQARRDEEIRIMPLFKNKKSKEKFARWFTVVFLVIFVAAIAGGLIVAGIASRPGSPVPILSPTP